jgi:predicted metal-dependent HD superfamily phosphohydrolase
MSSDVELRAAWLTHVGTDTNLFDRLLGRHRERHRRYHGVAHVRWVVRHVLELAVVESVRDLDAVIAAAFYHDAVYEPQHPANERASARLARRDLAEIAWGGTRIDAVVAMIEGTATHLEPPDIDTAVLYDADLAVLGADVVGYDAYAAGVRAEYRHVADHDWQVGRSAVLEGFLERPAIYATATGRKRWEQRARANITSELAGLGA